MKLLIIGCNGQVGWELVRCLQPLGEVISVGHRQLNLSKLGEISTTLRGIAPDVIVNAAAYTAVDEAEKNEAEANLINGYALEVIAAEAEGLGALLIHYSTDYIFDGSKPCPYTEDDDPSPINAYGRSKLMGEKAIQIVDGDYVILRTSWVYAARGVNFLRTILRLSQERDELRVVSDQIGAPTWARFIAESTVHVVSQSQHQRLEGSFVSNCYNLTASGEVSWYDFARAAVDIAKQLPNFSVRVKNITPITSDEYPQPAKRPKNSCLATNKLENHFGLKIPAWNDVLPLCIDEMNERVSLF